VPERVFTSGLPGFGPIVDEAAPMTSIAPNLAYGMWRMVSGLTHPSSSRSLSLSDVVVHDTADEAIGRAEITARPSIVNLCLEAGFVFHIAALDLAAELGNTPHLRFELPSDFPTQY
ncbi:MAG TPA: hypothetical protein VGM38_00530, partial [Pseudolysinimonas sp.]